MSVNIKIKWPLPLILLYVPAKTLPPFDAAQSHSRIHKFDLETYAIMFTTVISHMRGKIFNQLWL